MQGKLKKLKDNGGSFAYPITVAEAVFIDGNKTLKEAIADGSIGGSGGSAEVSVSGRPEAIFSLRGTTINVRKESTTNSCNYSFPPLDSDRYRRLFVWTGGGSVKWIDIPNGTLLENEALVYDITTNTITKKSGTWGNISVSTNEYLLMYNTLARIGGILSPYVSYGEDSISIPIREVEYESVVSNSGSVQGIIIVGDKLVVCTHSLDDHSDFVNLGVKSLTDPNVSVKTITHNLGHMNAPSYNSVKDSLIVGNGSKDYSLLPKGWILPNFAQLLNESTIDFNTVDKIELDFTQLTGEFKGQLCWGYPSTDIVYLFTNDNSILRKVLLGRGANNLGSGVFISGTSDTRYNGSYQILNTWRSRTQDILGGMLFYKGFIYTGVKGSNNIRKCIPLNNGYFDSEYIPLAGATGDMQGLDIANDYVYAFTDYKGYKFNVNKL